MKVEGGKEEVRNGGGRIAYHTNTGTITGALGKQRVGGRRSLYQAHGPYLLCPQQVVCSAGKNGIPPRSARGGVDHTTCDRHSGKQAQE